MFDLRFFRDSKGECQVLKTLKKLPAKPQAKAYVRIERLAELGNKLTRPESDYLRDGIYELRWRFVKVQYRLLLCWGTYSGDITHNNQGKGNS